MPMTGWCNICGWEGEFMRPERQREGMQCRNCSASSRQRALVRALGSVLGGGKLPLCLWPVRKEIAILESSARGPVPMLLREKTDYYATEYDPAMVAAGKAPREYADLQRLHFADQTFDVVIASDVFEHVRDDRAGYREVLRVLKDDGTLLLTVPYDHERLDTIFRVDTSGPGDLHLLQPEYHGGGGSTLTYRTYGRDLLAMLGGMGYSVLRLVEDIPEWGITPQSVFIARKAPWTEFFDHVAGGTPCAGTGPLLPFRAFLFFKYNLLGSGHYFRELKKKFKRRR
jgi:SAM-dependent methyltransferase